MMKPWREDLRRAVLTGVSTLVFLALIFWISLSCMTGIDREEAVPAAAIDGNVAKMRDLLRNGAPVNGRSDDGDTALMIAARANNLSEVQLLLSFGADPTIIEDDRTAKEMTTDRRIRALLESAETPASQRRFRQDYNLAAGTPSRSAAKERK